MNKNRLSVIVIIILLFLLGSCRNSPAGVDVIGVWDGGTQGLLDGNTLFIEFNNDGTARMMGDLMTEEGESQEFKWNMTDYHLEFSVPFTTFKSLYAYEYSIDSLTLYMLDDTNMNPEWDTLIPGYEIQLTRAAEGVRIEDLE